MLGDISLADLSLEVLLSSANNTATGSQLCVAVLQRDELSQTLRKPFDDSLSDSASHLFVACTVEARGRVRAAFLTNYRLTLSHTYYHLINVIDRVSMNKTTTKKKVVRGGVATGTSFAFVARNSAYAVWHATPRRVLLWSD